MILTLYILKKQREYINNYDLSHCNPGGLIKKFIASKLTITTLTSITIAGTLGVINGLDDTYAKFSGESAITKLGKYTGMYKGDNIVNDLPSDEITKD